ncbi:MAG: hypothetical protein KC613_06635 [Myxococcales bacterium]|nr:hypothetical protein [Myxococcales bacterium]
MMRLKIIAPALRNATVGSSKGEIRVDADGVAEVTAEVGHHLAQLEGWVVLEDEPAPSSEIEPDPTPDASDAVLDEAAGPAAQLPTEPDAAVAVVVEQPADVAPAFDLETATPAELRARAEALGIEPGKKHSKTLKRLIAGAEEA